MFLRSLRTALLCSLLATSGVLIPAVQAGGKSSVDNCIDRAAAVVPATISCITAESARQDKRLNQAYKQLLSLLSEHQKQALKQAQRDWIRYRDSNSSYYYDPQDGTDAHVNSVMKYEEMTKLRADELETELAALKMA
jgi:uncharacterized protein YecT (DUF1311 family)